MTTSKGQLILNVLTGVSATCAIVVTGLLLTERLRGQERNDSEASREEVVDSWQKYTKGAIRVGSPAAKITIVEFADFQCPFCREFAATLDTILQRYDGQVSWVYRHMPLTRIHPQAHAAARASLCANQQQQFESFHDVLYSHQQLIGVTEWDSLALRSGVRDIDRFHKCLSEDWQDNVIAADVAAAEELGIRGTPTFLVNGTLIRGAVSAARLDSLIVAARRKG